MHAAYSTTTTTTTRLQMLLDVRRMSIQLSVNVLGVNFNIYI